ncbi:DUF2306 domain-containing protein [uncultured Roseibium sp.]|uniref:DUF2306 domain-containing protein n=1 Tax=uncultured Roseibium sp. TaxID=1936171 RepID=UPI00260763AB|nr:DUF2306 domain-containing protein [uncultured Roseibium sp.]
MATNAAFAIGTVQTCAPKRTLRPKQLGHLWCALMLWTALSGFLIYDIRLRGSFSPIHLLSVMALVGLYVGVTEARRKEVARHRKPVIVLYSGALLVAGVFAMLPGRLMHHLLLL